MAAHHRILSALHRGRNVKQIAAETNLTEGTVRVYRTRIFMEYGVHDLPGLLVLRIAELEDQLSQIESRIA